MRKNVLKLSFLIFNLILFLTFTTACGGGSSKVEDADGNVYKSVKIGNQVWMAENLKTTKLNDGTLITMIEDDDAWKNAETPAYTFYDNNVANKDELGALYNYFAVETGKLCPKGWRVATDEDWKVLELFIGIDEEEVDEHTTRGSTEVSGLKKQIGNFGGTNELGFSAIPSGYRHSTGSFQMLNNNGSWWTSTELTSKQAWQRTIFGYEDTIDRSGYYKTTGHAVRCIRE